MKPKAAGCVVLRDNDGWEMLVLRTQDGSPDMPKGHIDTGETPFDAALRETSEEAGLDDITFPWGKKRCLVGGTTVMHLVASHGSPSISPNPETGKLEHASYAWVPIDEASEALDGCYLQPVVDWARRLADI